MTESNDSANRFRTADESIVGEAGAFLAAFRSLQMATVSADGVPDASYAPFVRIDDDAFYVNLSALSTHTGNILSTPRASTSPRVCWMHIPTRRCTGASMSSAPL